VCNYQTRAGIHARHFVASRDEQNSEAGHDGSAGYLIEWDGKRHQFEIQTSAAVRRSMSGNASSTIRTPIGDKRRRRTEVREGRHQARAAHGRVAPRGTNPSKRLMALIDATVTGQNPTGFFRHEAH
jgi:hypothetical protein